MSKNKKVTNKDITNNHLADIDYRINLIPNPTYYFQIGDNVSIGNLKDVIVENILYDGKVYKVDYTGHDNNYGHPIETSHIKGYWMWYDIRPISTVLTNGIINGESFRLNYGQRSILDILGKRYHFGIEMDPPYQRDYIWSEQDRILLIDSIFNCIDIGKFAFIKLEWDEHPLHYGYEILDGKQRIKTLCDFYENRFSYNGLFYNNLSTREQNHFEFYPISIAEVNKTTLSQTMQYFLRLNRTGRIMDKEHLEKVEKELIKLENIEK